MIRNLPPSLIALAAVALLAGAYLWLNQPDKREGMSMWTFTRHHSQMYEPVIEKWNEDHEPPVVLSTLNVPALERRMLSAFLSDTPVADMLEVEVNVARRAFYGPPEAVGFLDLKPRLEEAGLLQKLNPASLAPWTYGGRVFGIPHDVHPVLLGYRADLVEAAGIDVSKIETWEDFSREMAPLMADKDGDGQPDRYLLQFWVTEPGLLEVLMLQAGGRLIDEKGKPVLDSEVNARVLATAVTWCYGPHRIAADIPLGSASGYKLLSDGYAVCALLPDWRCGQFKRELPGLGGKMKLMPLPAWEKGGRRTSVMGGTMLGIPKASRYPDRAWEFATHLYLDPELAREQFERTTIISAVTELWKEPFYAEPDPYFSGQPSGTLFIEQASHVPVRTPSPFNSAAGRRVGDALIALKDYAVATGTYEINALLPEARRQLEAAQRDLERLMQRNVIAEEALDQ